MQKTQKKTRTTRRRISKRAKRRRARFVEETPVII